MITRAELLEQLLTERFGPTRDQPTPTPTQQTATTLEHERDQQRLRRQALEANHGQNPHGEA